MTNTQYPIRINRYLAQKGYASRRGADLLIESRQVRINGRIAKIGDQVTEGDTVTVLGQAPLSSYTYLAYHKPVGIVTNAPAEGETDIATAARLDPHENLQPVGRLDKDSSGLILITNDTRIVGPLLSPQTRHEKEYRVTVQEPIRRDFEQRMESGVKLSDYRTKPCQVVVHDRHTFSIMLTEGKHRQIRRMCATLGYSVTGLLRVRIGHINLDDLQPGRYRALTPSEHTTLLETLGISA